MNSELHRERRREQVTPSDLAALPSAIIEERQETCPPHTRWVCIEHQRSLVSISITSKCDWGVRLCQEMDEAFADYRVKLVSR